MRASARIHVSRGESAVTLAAGDLEATFHPSFGMLGTSLRYRGEEHLALPGGVAAWRRGLMTGFPLLAPWANRLSGRRYRIAGTGADLRGLQLRTDERGLPIHGTIGAEHAWEVLGLEADGDAARLRVRLPYEAPELLRAFPFPHELTLDVAVGGNELAVTTTVRPTGDRSVPVAFGFHPYLRLPRGARDAWRLHLPGGRHLRLDRRGIPTGTAHPLEPEDRRLGSRTFDDLYAPDGRKLAISHGRRRLELRLGDGYPFAQVYAPAGRRFVCLEPMTAPTNALGRGDAPLVEPGEAFTARFSVAIEDREQV